MQLVCLIDSCLFSTESAFLLWKFVLDLSCTCCLLLKRFGWSFSLFGCVSRFFWSGFVFVVHLVPQSCKESVVCFAESRLLVLPPFTDYQRCG